MKNYKEIKECCKNCEYSIHGPEGEAYCSCDVDLKIEHNDNNHYDILEKLEKLNRNVDDNGFCDNFKLDKEYWERKNSPPPKLDEICFECAFLKIDSKDQFNIEATGICKNRYSFLANSCIVDLRYSCPCFEPIDPDPII